MLATTVSVFKTIKAINPNLETGPWIAGGAARLLFTRNFSPTHDIDVFFKDEEQFLSLKEQLSANKNYSLAISTDNASTFMVVYDTDMPYVDYIRMIDDPHYIHDLTDTNYKKKPASYNMPIRVQLIKNKFYSSVHDVLNSFDITVCQFATDGYSIVYGKNSIRDLYDNTLRFNVYNNNALKRYVKYRSYGFKDKTNELKRLLETVDQHEVSAVDY